MEVGLVAVGMIIVQAGDDLGGRHLVADLIDHNVDVLAVSGRNGPTSGHDPSAQRISSQPESCKASAGAIGFWEAEVLP
jgi:hypothetical protein